ncbi:MAG TPA: pyridoxamine 5'-phosphate oxidase family protein [Actinomycetota bacterium]|nr:pyridoxamine 5'-phosphate oxidase family protein [Actinomycetota bacterium]
MTSLSPDALEALRTGSFCHVAAPTERGPHLTPLVFALSDDRLWLTTSRGSVKARAWRRDARVTGLVRGEGVSVAFGGRVRTYDLLDPETWGRALLRTPALVAASLRFTRKNARFFAGYAVDAEHVPLAWTPPGRLFVEVEIERAALVDEFGVIERRGRWSPSVASIERFRARPSGAPALAALPGPIREALSGIGQAVLAVHGAAGGVVLPARFVEEGPALLVAVPREGLELAGCDRPTTRAALAIDRPSSWRARLMTGATAIGEAELVVPALLTSGTSSALQRIGRTGAPAQESALVRLRPHRIVWWSGWTSGTVVCRG